METTTTAFVAVRLISAIRWKPFREMEMENERGKEAKRREGRNSTTESKNDEIEADRETQKKKNTAQGDK